MNTSNPHFLDRRGVQRAVALLAVGAAGLLLVVAALLFSGEAAASSHREAPLISKDPQADNTDTYVFIPEGSTERLVLAASWIPFEGPEGGPNYYEWDDQVLYDIYVDVNGDAAAEITYTLRSRTDVRNPLDTFLYNTGPIDTVSSPNWNRPQYYTVTEQFAPGFEPAGSAATNLLVQDQLAPPVNIGSKSTPDWDALMAETIYDYSDSNGDQVQIYAGPTDDPFWVDLQVFDLLTLRGQDPPVGYSSGTNLPVDSLSGFNVHSLVLELPIDRLTRDGEPVLGVWSGSRRTGMGVFTGSGDPVQVSRLGMPLVNEVVLPMGLKDTFNTIPPSADLSIYTTLQEYVENPEVGTLLCGLYGVPLPADSDDDCNTEYTPGTPRTGRGDIFDIFLTGMVLENPFNIVVSDGTTVTLPAGFNVNQPSGVVPAEMIRINTAISGTLCAPAPSRLGVLGGDACGFPNGRRLTDDVVEIELLAVAGAAYEVLDDRDTSFQFNAAFIDVLDDNVDANDQAFATSFPYLAAAQSGQSHWHDNPVFAAILPVIRSGSTAAQDAVSQLPEESAAVAAGTLAIGLPVALLWWRRREDDLLPPPEESGRQTPVDDNR